MYTHTDRQTEVHCAGQAVRGKMVNRKTKELGKSKCIVKGYESYRDDYFNRLNSHLCLRLLSGPKIENQRY